MRGTIHEIHEWEQLFIQSMPHTLFHDGHFEPSEFDPARSASNVPAQSESYARKYMLFPQGRRQLWEERVRVIFYYDERHGTGTMYISSRGLHLLSAKLKIMLIDTSQAKVPLKNVA